MSPIPIASLFQKGLQTEKEQTRAITKKGYNRNKRLKDDKKGKSNPKAEKPKEDPDPQKNQNQSPILRKEPKPKSRSKG